MTKLNRSWVAKSIAMGASLLLLAGCATNTDNNTGQPDEDYGQTHTLVIANSGPATTLDPAVGGNLANNLIIIGSIYSALTRTNAEGELIGDLATNWEAIDEDTWRFTLREDVQFSDGTPLNAEVIKANIARVQSPDNSGWIKNSIARVTEVEVVDEFIVDFHTDGPDIELPRRLAGIFYLEPTWAADNNPAIEALGSGPYKLVSFAPDSSIKLTANELYYGEPVGFTNVEFRVVADAAQRVNGIISGEIDAAPGFTPLEYDQLVNKNGVVVEARENTRVSIIRFNTNIEPFNDTRVRAAINYAIDKQTITDTIFKGLTSPAKSQIITELHEGFNTDLDAWPYDPAKATELLTEAGYPDGFEFELLAQPRESLEAQVIVEQLAAVGLKANLEVVPSSVMHERGQSQTDAPAASFWGYADTASIASETLTYIGSTHFQTIGPIPGTMNEAIAEAQAATSKEAELAAVKRATQAAVDDALAVFLWPFARVFAHSDKVQWELRQDDWVLPQLIKPAN